MITYKKIKKLTYKNIKRYLNARKWYMRSKQGKVNFKINRILYPTGIVEYNDPADTILNISPDEMKRAMQYPGFERYSLGGYPHTKIIEYLSTIKLLNIQNGDCILDAAGGADAEYLLFLKEYVGLDVQLIGQDKYEKASSVSSLRFISGSVDDLPLDDNSVSGISCHHSFEHFRGDIDIGFIKECLRVLCPGGKLIITPLFITNLYAEIWNNDNIETFDKNALQIVDKTASFCGWGDYEGFARVYNHKTFMARIVNRFISKADFKVYQVTYDNMNFPDMNIITNQPTLNAENKVLEVIKK